MCVYISLCSYPTSVDLQRHFHWKSGKVERWKSGKMEKWKSAPCVSHFLKSSLQNVSPSSGLQVNGVEIVLRWIINYTPLPTWCCVIAWHYRYLEFSKVFHCDRFALRCRRTKCCVKMSNTANVCLSLHCPVYIQCCVYSITTKVEAKWPWPLLDSCILSFPPNRWNTVCIASRQGNPWTNVITTLLVMWLFF